MRVRFFNDVASFLAVAEPLLAAEPVLYGQLLGIARMVEEKPDIYGKNPPYFLSIEDDAGAVCGAALRTPPFPLCVSRLDPAQAEALVDYFVDAGFELPAVSGPADAARYFAEAGARRGDVEVKPGKRLRLYELTQVEHVIQKPGRLRVCGSEDLDLVYEWICRFSEDADLSDEKPPRDRVAYRVAAGDQFLWEVGGEPRCLVGKSNQLLYGVSRVNSVYTPREQRCQGYATDATAAITQRLLDEGAEFSSLFTDLANPTSNSIYQKIGYRPVADFEQFWF